MTAAAQLTHPLPQSPATFEAMGLSAPALAALARIGFQTPTPIQAGAIPPALLFSIPERCVVIVFEPPPRIPSRLAGRRLGISFPKLDCAAGLALAHPLGISIGHLPGLSIARHLPAVVIPSGSLCSCPANFVAIVPGPPHPLPARRVVRSLELSRRAAVQFRGGPEPEHYFLFDHDPANVSVHGRQLQPPVCDAVREPERPGPVRRWLAR